MTEFDNLCFALAVLWTGALVCFIMKWFRYFISADMGMALILLCFTALAIRHNIQAPQLASTAAAAAPLDYLYVTRDGDGFFHTSDCERLRGSPNVTPYAPQSHIKHACIDCIMPQVNRMAHVP